MKLFLAVSVCFCAFQHLGSELNRRKQGRGMDQQPASTTPTTVSDERTEEARARLYGRWLVLIRIICLVLVAYTLGFFATGIVIAFAQHRAICTGLTCALSIPEALIYFAVAALIFWYKSDDWMA